MSKNELQEVLMGAALVALGYALYKHFKAPATATAAPSAAVIAASDQAAIETAIDSAPSDGPAMYIPAPIPVNGSAATGYTANVPNSGWLTKIEDILQGAL